MYLHFFPYKFYAALFPLLIFPFFMQDTPLNVAMTRYRGKQDTDTDDTIATSDYEKQYNKSTTSKTTATVCTTPASSIIINHLFRITHLFPEFLYRINHPNLRLQKTKLELHIHLNQPVNKKWFQ